MDPKACRNLLFKFNFHEISSMKFRRAAIAMDPEIDGFSWNFEQEISTRRRRNRTKKDWTWHAKMKYFSQNSIIKNSPRRRRNGSRSSQKIDDLWREIDHENCSRRQRNDTENQSFLMKFRKFEYEELRTPPAQLIKASGKFRNRIFIAMIQQW